jgi:hypothetical protein
MEAPYGTQQADALGWEATANEQPHLQALYEVRLLHHSPNTKPPYIITPPTRKAPHITLVLPLLVGD